MNDTLSITLSREEIYLKVGTWYHEVSATVNSPCPECVSVTWHTSNPSVASVNASKGYIYANGVGTATIYATATDKYGNSCTDSLTVTVSKPILASSVILNRESLSLAIGTYTTLSATVLPENTTNDNVIWCSTDPHVASVNGGTVFAHTEGEAIIRATTADGSGKKAECRVTVSPLIPIQSLEISEPPDSMCVGDSAVCHVIYTPTDATNKALCWRSSNPCVATVNPQSGLVIAQKPGTTKITATATDGSGASDSFCLTVIPPTLVESISLSHDYAILDIGECVKLCATVCPEDATNPKIRWCSEDSHIACVDPNTGVVVGLSAGETKIYAHATDGSEISEFCYVDVLQTHVSPGEDHTPKANQKISENYVADPVDAYTGAHVLTASLMSLMGGQGLSLTAHYDSTRLVHGSLGIGWYHSYEKHLEYGGCEVLVYSNPSTFSRYVARPDNPRVFECASPEKMGYVLTHDPASSTPFVLDCNSEQTEFYDACGNLVKIRDRMGFEILLSYAGSQITLRDGITGKRIYLEKDASCKVVRVYDDAARETVLTYTGDLLTSIRDINGNTLSYTYDTVGRVLFGTDSMGIRYFENTYDKLGRVSTQKDAISGSACTLFAYDGNKRTVTNRNGKQSTREYNDQGLLIKHTDENGNQKTYTYDDRYNVIKETDARGNSVVKSYNRFNKPTALTDKNGNTTAFTYDTKGNVTKIRYPEVNGVCPEETFVYNERNQLTQHTDLRGTVTLYTYDVNGLPATKKVGGRNATVYSYEGGLLKSVTDPMGHTARYAHNTLGQTVSLTDADEKVTTYAYDALGNLLRTTDPCGKSIVNTYDSNYQKTTVTDANGNTTSYSYNGNMKNDAVTHPDGNTVRYEFDGEDRPIKITDRENNVTTITYDDGGRVLTKKLPDGATVRYEYDELGNVIKETNPKGATITKTYDAMGNVLTATDHEGNVTRYQYNAMSKPVRVVNSVAGTTVYEYATSGELLSETDAMGNKTSYTYDAFGNRLTATDAMGHVTTYTYDDNGNPLTVKDALGHITTYTYDALGRCVSVKDAQNNVIRYGYDALGRRTTVTDARGNVFTTTYDGNGNVIKTTDAKGNTVSETVYNCLNLPLTVTDAMGKTTTYTYNALGKVESVTDSMNHRTEFTYNSRGQNTAVRDAMNGTSTATYDLLGNVTRLAGPLGGATNYTYDEMGRLTSESTVSGGTKSYEYNELNIRDSLTNARGKKRKLFYDAMGRITGYTSPEDAVSYTYDKNGNVLTVTDSHGTIKRTYDALNRVSSYTDTYGNVIRYEYDAVGNLSKIIYPDNTAVSYAYDANHNLIRVTDWANRVTSYTYDENNRVVGVTKPNGSVTTTVYDNKQRVTSTVEKTASGTVITGFEYTYDDLSRIVEEKCLDKNIKLCYTYDSLGRVTTRAKKNAITNIILSSEAFSYDAAGNITGSSTDTTLVYDINNRLTSYNGNEVSYDLDGNMLSNGSLSCSYDSANRLISAGGHTYTYNAEDVRIRNHRVDVDTTYVYDTNVKLSRMLMKTTNGIVTKYVYGLGLIGEEKEACFKTYHFDSRGSTVAITDEACNIIDTFAYDTYGKCISHIGSSFVIFGYNGRDGVVTETNGLIYMRARYYSPDMRRFINADIVAGDISNAVTLNRFAYANGNPVFYSDPFGLSAERDAVFANYAEQSAPSVFVKNPLNNSSTQHFYLGRIIRNPWRELSYPGLIHAAVVVHLASTHKLIPEYVPLHNMKNRYDLYAPANNQYWEVKPVSYIGNIDKAMSMEAQMYRYDQDGAIRGFPLGNSEFQFGDYKVKIYSSIPGKVYYSFEREEKKEEQEEYEMIPEKEESKEINPVPEKQKKFDWESVGETVATYGGIIIGTAAIVGGLYMLCTTGDSSGLNQGLQYWQRALA